MKKTKIEKGITLIALIITIVILLILAVVTIGSIRESKIIGHAKNASDKYTIAQEKEQIQLALSEWQIQKNAPGNTQNFKNVIETELSDSTTVIGENDGPLTVIFKETENEYTVTSEGKIKSAIPMSVLERYLLGEDLAGRNALDIFNDDLTNKKDETLGIEEGDIVPINICNPSGRINGDNFFVMYFKCNNRVYKTKFDYDNDVFTTDPDSGITEVYNYNNQETRVGKKVKINNVWWTILYDDEKYGLQIIGGDEFYLKSKLGYYNGKSNYGSGDFNSLDKTTDEFEYSDLDNSNSINTDVEKALYSYNNAIDYLNLVAEGMLLLNVGCRTEEEWENYKGKYIEFVRSVGSDPNNKDAESDVYESDNLNIWPINNTTYSAGIANGRIKDEDLNYESDVDRMVALGIANLKDNAAYWLASRTKKEVDNKIYYDIRNWDVHYTETGSEEILCITESGIYNGHGDYAVRPVVKLKSDVQFNGTGTETDPYTFAE